MYLQFRSNMADFKVHENTQLLVQVCACAHARVAVPGKPGASLVVRGCRVQGWCCSTCRHVIRRSAQHHNHQCHGSFGMCCFSPAVRNFPVLFLQFRDNILAIINAMEAMGGVMAQMPQLPVRCGPACRT